MLLLDGAREVDVVAAWLANLSEDHGQEYFTTRLQRRLVGAADQKLRDRVLLVRPTNMTKITVTP